MTPTRDQISEWRFVLHHLIAEAEVRGHHHEADSLRRLDAFVANSPTSEYGAVAPWPPFSDQAVWDD